ncbi:protein SOSEKI 2 [Trifolium pratense]|nr:protein SOSEKI 2 [Trifolium pratense]
MDIRSHRGGRETSPDRAKICRMKQKVKPIRKVQVVYYLSRNGLLEHPHFMEVTLSPNQPLRLKDVFDRLMALRGTGMPAQYSWSTKRNYKSGYVWHDLALQDIIHPSEGGAEYVLKGSELVEGSCSERFQQLNLSDKQGIQQHPEQNFTSYRTSKSKVTTLSGNCQQKLESEDQYEEYEEELLGDGEKTSYTSSTTTPHSRCSRGVSTEELDEVVITNSHNTPQPHPVANSTTTLAEKLKQREERKVNNVISANFPKRLGNESLTSAPATQSRYSVLLQLIACGSSGAEMKAKQQGEARLSNVGTTSKRRESVDEEEKVYSSGDGEDLCVSENPRLLGNLQSEEKEYFSGSIVESMKANRVAFQTEPVLKKSNSYNEERRSRLGMEEVKERKGGVREKCIPLKKSSKESRK